MDTELSSLVQPVHFTLVYICQETENETHTVYVSALNMHHMIQSMHCACKSLKDGGNVEDIGDDITHTHPQEPMHVLSFSKVVFEHHKSQVPSSAIF